MHAAPRATRALRALRALRAPRARRAFRALAAPSILALALALASGPPARAGDLNPPPGPVAPTMKALSDIEPRTCVNALPGAPDAMHVITQPGSYYLSDHIVAPPGKRAIRVSAVGDVTIDGAGFSTSASPGPAGEEIYCDGPGRVKIRFHWDRAATGHAIVATSAVEALILEDVAVTDAALAAVRSEAMFTELRRVRIARCADGVIALAPLRAREVHLADIAGVALRAEDSADIEDCLVERAFGGAFVAPAVARARTIRVEAMTAADCAQAVLVQSAPGFGGSASFARCVARSTTGDAFALHTAPNARWTCSAAHIAATDSAGAAVRLQVSGSGAALVARIREFAADSCNAGLVADVDLEAVCDLAMALCAARDSLSDGFAIFQPPPVSLIPIFSTSLLAEGCTASASGGHGFRFENASVQAESCRAYDNAGDGFFCRGNSVRKDISVVLRSCDAAGNGGSGVDAALLALQMSHDTLVRNGLWGARAAEAVARLEFCEFRANGAAGGGGILLVDTAGSLHRIAVDDSLGHGVSISGGHAVMIDSSARASAGNGVDVTLGASLTPATFICRALDASGNSGSGLALAGASLDASSSSFSLNNGNGIQFLPGGPNPGRFSVRATDCAGNAANGLFIDGAAGGILDSVLIQNCGLDGVQLGPTTVGAELFRVTVRDALGGAAFRVLGPDNLIHQCVADGLHPSGDFVVAPGNCLAPVRTAATLATATNPFSNLSK